MAEYDWKPETKSEGDLLDLAVSERTVALRVAGERHLHVFRPPTVDDWIVHERSLRPTLRVEDDQVETSVALLAANNALWESHILRVEAGEKRETLEPQTCSLEERHQAILGLGIVAPAEIQEEIPDALTVPVTLTALWNGRRFPRLVHRFKRPSVEHEIRYKEALARSAILAPRPAGNRKRPAAQAVVSLPQLPALLKLYDELIDSIEGYAFAGARLKASDAMDPLHKSAAIRALFERGRREIELDEE